MSFKMWLVLILGFVNYPLQIRAEDEKKTCAAHEKWTVFQRRKHGNVDFFRGWDDYVNGFGNCDGDLWLGLETLHELTKGDDMSLEINMMSGCGSDHFVARYRYFRIGPGYDFYRLHVSGHSGTVERDGLTRHNNLQFSTYDADHDGHSSYDCATYNEGGWWYDTYCGLSNLSGNFNKTGWKGIWWNSHVTSERLCCSEMKVYKRT